jgi:hypothetical protein
LSANRFCTYLNLGICSESLTTITCEPGLTDNMVATADSSSKLFVGLGHWYKSALGTPQRFTNVARSDAMRLV